MMRRAYWLLLAMAACAAAGPLPPTALRCEYMVNPVGIDVASPRLYWVPAHTERGARQTAYQVLVGTTPGAAQAGQWDSGKVASAGAVHIAYGGKALESGRTYYWKVRYWDQADQPSAYSPVATFETALLSSADWQAQWVTGGNVLRREFTLAAAPVRARAYVAGIGYYELRLNGGKVGDHVLDPGYTPFDKRVLYVTYDITSQLRAGANAVGLMLGEGWYRARAARLQLEIDLPGGRRVRISTDASWKTAQGPILADSIYNGETYDATRELTGWDSPGYDDRQWKPVSPDETPHGVLSAQMMPPIRVVANLPARKMTSPRQGVYVFDMGQNFSGWTRLRVRGPAGTRVVMRHSELLYEDGTLNVENLRAAKATDTYVLRGDADGETWEPHFTYHGFRYVELTGYPGTPRLDSVMGREVHTDVRPAGSFAASKPLLNQLQQNIVWGVKSNLHSIPTDCDQRDERMGWMADAHLAAETAMLNFDMAAFYTNFLRSIRDDQDEDGSLPDTVPRGRLKPPADPAWGSAYPLLLKYMWEQYGDRRIVEQHFEGIRRWAEFLHTKADADGIVSFVKYGDWVPTERTPGDLVSTAYYYLSVDTVARMAEVLGKSPEAAQYRTLADSVAAGFQKRFYRADSHSYANGSQTANTLPLFFGITPSADRGSVQNSLNSDIVYSRNTHLSTGILGTKYLLPLLSQEGRPDLAYDLATQTTYPSWGYMIEKGATTIWELWQDVEGPSMNSHNHAMFGSVGAWFYTSLAGIHVDPQYPGYERIRIQPEMVRDLHYASASIDTVRGRVASAWQREPGRTRLEVTVPPGSTAEIYVPAFGNADVTVEEGGHAVWKGRAFVAGAPGVEGARAAGEDVVIKVASGTYVFEVN
ncbi:MAG: family 78 glycoside hydrolase catalytic domain [Bryobacteraceae bacterium]